MKLIINELISSLIMSSIVTILVLLNSPYNLDKNDYKKRPVTIAVKAFIISFIVTFSILYFISDPPKCNVMKNVIQSEPDF